MTIQHTPGPWLQDGACIETAKRHIAIVGWNDVMTPEDDANAQFIVCAANSHAELLAACADATGHMHCHVKGVYAPQPNCDCSGCEMANQLQRAIARAEGKEIA